MSLLAVVLGAGLLAPAAVQGAASTPMAEMAVQATRLCISVQKGEVDLRGEDTGQVKIMAMPHPDGGGGVFMSLGDERCDVLVGTDGGRIRDHVRDWLKGPDSQDNWQAVPTLGRPGQGARGDMAEYYVAEDYSASLALSEASSGMFRVVVMPQSPREMMEAVIETAKRAATRPADEAVFNAIETVCQRLGVEDGERSAKDEAVLAADFLRYTGTGGELHHGGDEAEKVIMRSEDGTCFVAAKAKDAQSAQDWGVKVQRGLVQAGWYHNGEDVLLNNDGRRLQMMRQNTDLLIEVEQR